jgi:hypothetical protein
MSKIYPIPLKYSDKDGKGYCDALIPSEVRHGCNAKGIYRCSGGELVTIEWLRVVDNTSGRYDDVLDGISRDLYNLPFNVVRSQWFARIKKIEGYWDKIRCRIFIEDESDKIKAIPRKGRRRN